MPQNNDVENPGAASPNREKAIQIFQPLFEPYSDKGGMPRKELMKMLHESGLTAGLHPKRIDYITSVADRNKDGRINYEEFKKLVNENRSSLNTVDLTKFQRFVRSTVSSVVPAVAHNKNGKHTVDDYIDHYDCKPPPFFIIIMSIAEIGVFCYYVVLLKDTPHKVTLNGGVPINSSLVYNPSRRYELWRFLSYTLIHMGYEHIMGNVIFQILIGIPLEMVHKWWRVGIIYCMGCLAGSACHSIVDPKTYLVGASGGCYSLIGAHFAVIIINWKEMTHDWMSGPVKIASSGPFRLLIWLLLVSIDFGSALYRRYSMDQETNVGYAAHIGGAITGLMLGISILKNFDVLQWEKILLWVSLLVYLMLVGFSIAWNILYKGFPETDWSD